MVLGKERAVTHLNSWNRCLVREDGMLSPASLYLLTVVACTRSWSQMAALWRTIHRRTGETTVRISMAIQQIRNWVRKPMHVCCLCMHAWYVHWYLSSVIASSASSTRHIAKLFEPTWAYLVWVIWVPLSSLQIEEFLI